jgi:acyl-CoA thioesterase-1
MARAGQVKKVGTALAGVLTISLIAGAVFGEGSSPAAPAAPMPPVVTPAPFSPECQGGTTEIVTESPLPHVAAALMKRRTVRILAIGNSTGRRQGGFTRQIERILKQVVKGADVVIINRGVSGELAANASLRIKNEVALTSPDLVIWQVGTDDALAFVPLDEVRESVESTIRWLKEHNVDVVLAGLQYVDRVAQDDNYYRMR